MASMTGAAITMSCPVCGGSKFAAHRVLWPELVSEWELADHEHAYVDVQQGSVCDQCGANIRSAALAKAISVTLNHDGTLDELVATKRALRLLEINEAGTLHSRLAQIPGHVFGQFPECDMMSLLYRDGELDMVVHSDTLEHVADPARALQEIHRVLVAGGVTVFTVPIVVGRMSRSREGMPASYHGAPGTDSDDLLVRTEFGADVWCMVLAAGFARCEMVSYCYPAGIAVVARK